MTDDFNGGSPRHEQFRSPSEDTVNQAVAELKHRVQNLEEASLSSAVQSFLAACLQQWATVVGTLHETLPGFLKEVGTGAGQQLDTFLRQTSCTYAACGLVCASIPTLLHRLTLGLIPGFESPMVLGTATLFGGLMTMRLLHEATSRCMDLCTSCKVAERLNWNANKRRIVGGTLLTLGLAVGGYRLYWLTRELGAARLTVQALRTENTKLQSEMSSNAETMAAIRSKAQGLAELLGVGSPTPAAAPAPAPQPEGQLEGRYLPWRFYSCI